jgi:hypothetical protein
MEQELDVPCRGAGGEACAEIIHYKREAIKGSWRSIVIYLTCKNGHTNAYEIPVQPETGATMIRGTAGKKTSPSQKSRLRTSRRPRRHER